MRLFLIFIAGILTGCSCYTPLGAQTVVPVTETFAPAPGDTMIHDILRLVNRHRSIYQEKPLELLPGLNRIAWQHSDDMAHNRVPIGHDGFDARVTSIQKLLPGTMGFGENVAEGAKDAEDVVHMWLTSEGHKANIEGDFQLTGIGIAADKDGELYFTQIFVRK